MERWYSYSELKYFLFLVFFLWNAVTIKVLPSFITQLKMMIRLSAAGEGQLWPSRNPWKGSQGSVFTLGKWIKRFCATIETHLRLSLQLKKNSWVRLAKLLLWPMCVYRRCLLKRAGKIKFSKYQSILMYGTVQNDSWNAWKVFHFKVFCHKKKLKSRSDWGILMCLLWLI